jgi:colanic acid/amylovoran biosynthesis protein
MNILIVNYHSDRNAGDKVLLAVTLDQLRCHFPQAHVTVVTNDPANYGGDEPSVGSFTTWVKKDGSENGGWRIGSLLALPYWGIIALIAVLAHRLGFWPKGQSQRQRSQPYQLLRAYADADLVVSCAGNFLYSGGSVGLAFLLAAISLGYGILMGKAVYTMPQTIGPLHRGWEKKILAWILPRLRLVLVRDRISQELVQNLTQGRKTNCRLVPDIAFAFQGASRERGRQFLAQAGLPSDAHRPLLGITAINWGEMNRAFTTQPEYEQALAATATHFIRTQGGRVVIFAQVCGPTSSEDDRIPARRIRGLIPHATDDVLLVDEIVPAEMLQAAYGNMDLFLGSRLHSNIFALIAGVPVLAVAYQYKTFGVMDLVGLREWTLDIAETTPQALTSMLDKLWAHRTDIATQIQQRTPGIRTEIDQALVFMAQDIQSR